MATYSDSDSDVRLQVPQSSSDLAERQFVLKLIELYRENPLLWDVKNENYSNKYGRVVTLRNICNELKPYKPSYTVEELKKKLNILRTNFNKERNKIETKRKYMPADEEPGPILWYYNEMKFLIGQQVQINSVGNKPANVSVENNTESPHNKTHRNLKRKKLSIISESSLGVKKPENEEELMVRCWVMKLRKLSPDQRLYTEKIINDTLFEAEMGSLTRYGASFNSTPEMWAQYSNESHSPVYTKSPKS